MIEEIKTQSALEGKYLAIVLLITNSMNPFEFVNLITSLQGIIELFRDGIAWKKSRQGISHRQNLSVLWFKWNMFRVKSKFEWWQTKLGNFGNCSSSFCFFFFHLQCNFKLDNKLLIFVEIIGKKLLRYRAVFNLQTSTHTHTSLSLSLFLSLPLSH